MRFTPHPLTTIVAFHSGQTLKHKACGLLVSSFNTVTLYPRPIVSFNIKLPSSTYDAITQSGSFTASGIRSAVVASEFVKSRDESRTLDKIVDTEGRLRDGNSGTWWMMCRLIKEQCVDIGDHVIVIGEVFNAASYSGEQCNPGIVYVDGHYRRAAEILNTKAPEE